MSVKYINCDRSITFLYSYNITKDRYEEMATIYSLKGDIVLFPSSFFDYEKYSITEEEKDRADFERLDICDELVIFTKNGIKNNKIEMMERRANMLHKKVTHLIDTD